MAKICILVEKARLQKQVGFGGKNFCPKSAIKARLSFKLYAELTLNRFCWKKCQWKYCTCLASFVDKISNTSILFVFFANE